MIDLENLNSSWSDYKKYLYNLSCGSNPFSGSEIESSEDIYDHCWLTLTFDPVTLSRLLVSRKPANA